MGEPMIDGKGELSLEQVKQLTDGWSVLSDMRPLVADRLWKEIGILQSSLAEMHKQHEGFEAANVSNRLRAEVAEAQLAKLTAIFEWSGDLSDDKGVHPIHGERISGRKLEFYDWLKTLNVLEEANARLQTENKALSEKLAAAKCVIKKAEHLAYVIRHIADGQDTMTGGNEYWALKEFHDEMAKLNNPEAPR